MSSGKIKTAGLVLHKTLFLTIFKTHDLNAFSLMNYEFMNEYSILGTIQQELKLFLSIAEHDKQSNLAARGSWRRCKRGSLPPTGS